MDIGQTKYFSYHKMETLLGKCSFIRRFWISLTSCDFPFINNIYGASFLHFRFYFPIFIEPYTLFREYESFLFVATYRTLFWTDTFLATLCLVG